MYKIFLIIFSLSFLLISGNLLEVNAQTVNSWITNANQSALLQQQAAVNFAAGSGPTISVNTGTTYQTIDGYGFCLTEGSAEAINALNATQQTNLLNEFFNTSTGMGVSVVRISIGASDLSSSSYSYNDGGVDVNQNNFSLSGPDLTYVVPLVKRILQINPNIKILATPWSAPRWMKTNNAWIGGSLNTSYYASYATYFVKYINAMKAQGIDIWAVTPQNEPENPYNEPSMTMNATEETNFINNNLGPAFQSAGFSTKIIAFDHNCDNTAYPTQVLNGSSYADGAAFHLYAGNISALTTVHNATGKNVYFTEQYTSTTGGFSGDFSWHIQNVMIGSMNNWARTALEWNLATDAGYGPKTPGGCTTCLGAVTINNSSTYTRNVSYYIIAQLSKFLKTGAVRIASSSSNGSLQNVAFRNPDGSVVLVVFNSGGDQTFTVGSGSNTFSYTLTGSSAVSFVWNTSIPSSTGIVTTYADCSNAGFSGGFTTGDYTLAQMQALGVADNSVSSITIKPGYKAVVYENDNFGGASYTITADNSCLVAAGWNDRISSLKVLPNGVTGLNNTYYIQNRNSGLFLKPTGGAVDNGTTVTQWGLEETDNERFAFTDTGDGVYKIIHVSSGRSLDIEGAGTDQGRVLQIWDYYSTATNQQFIVAPVGDGFYKLIPRHSNQIIEVKDASTAAGYRVQQWNDNGQTCGQWKFKPVTTVGTGTGLIGNYFNGMNFDALKYSATDATINFNWGTGSPNAAVNADQFSARWTGQIQPKYTEEYTFYINSDNGRRLWINNQLIIDKWLDDVTEYTGKITLTAGQKYEIKIEYFENNGGANAKLEWSSFMQDREVVPQTQLYPNPLPTVSITSPANNAGFTAPASITINATAADGDGVAKVDFYNGTALIGTDASSPYSYTWTNVAYGTYNITALATDSRGGVTLSAVITVKVNQPPTVSITSPLTSATFTAPATVSIAATAADADGTIQKVEFYNGSTLLGTDNSSPYTYSWTGVTAGTYSLTAKAYDDKAGITTSSVVTIVVSNPNQAPTVSITSPDSGDHFTSPATVSIIATAQDADGSILKVEFYNGSTKLGEDAASPFSYDWFGVAEGSYALTAVATDDQGATTVSDVFTLIVDAALPTGIEDANEEGGIALYPNPVSDELMVRSSQVDLSQATYQLIDVTGRVVAQGSNLSHSIYLVAIESGVYVLMIKNLERLFIRSIIKQ